MGVKYIIDKNELKYRHGYVISHYMSQINKIKGLEEYTLEMYGYKNNWGEHESFPYMFFTYEKEYFNVRLKFKLGDTLVGSSTISCFPHCCGVAIITANYSTFRERFSDVEDLKIGTLNLLTSMLLAHSCGKYPSAIAIERENSMNMNEYKAINWKEEGKCFGKSENTLLHLTKDLKEKDWLEEIFKLYGENEKNINKKQTPKPSTTKRLVTLDEE